MSTTNGGAATLPTSLSKGTLKAIAYEEATSGSLPRHVVKTKPTNNNLLAPHDQPVRPRTAPNRTGPVYKSYKSARAPSPVLHQGRLEPRPSAAERHGSRSGRGSRGSGGSGGSRVSGGSGCGNGSGNGNGSGSGNASGASGGAGRREPPAGRVQQNTPPTIDVATCDTCDRVNSRSTESLPATNTDGKKQRPFLGINTDIPAGQFEEELSTPDRLTFTRRGSLLIGGKKPTVPPKGYVYNSSSVSLNDSVNANGSVRSEPPIGPIKVRSRTRKSDRQPSMSMLSQISISKRVISADEDMLSRKVRAMYDDSGDDDTFGTDQSSESESEEGRSLNVQGEKSRRPSTRPGTTASGKSSLRRREHERAGGIEDWKDMEGHEIDRYGFIVPKRQQPVNSSDTPGGQNDPQRIQRVATLLELASETPRRKKTLRRRPSIARSFKSAKSARTLSPNGRKYSLRSIIRPSSSASSHHPSIGGTSLMRVATNHLPHNRDRRLKDEAADMLTAPPGFEEDALAEATKKAAEERKKREWQREEKWRKMAKIVRKKKDGGGMQFEFDIKSPKLIERTWKGIPDRWRSTAWHAFLTASARKDPNSASDQELVASFKELLDQSSPDDMQIDIDVPRTINQHIMFRRRYKGGQRLLFRVLHSMSLFFPETGYVQGMASLVATLLCYYDEETTFVMMVRIWQLRGLERLYKTGFEGLIEALDDFEKNWLEGGEVQVKLDSLNIVPTAYGTRWYLTLFNYSIPFPAQLRVWDVFLLLGDSDLPIEDQPVGGPREPAPFGRSLDVLHATSAALIDGTRDILLDSDFEEVMKVLTSFIPIRDEEMLMRVAKAEWKMHRKRYAEKSKQ